jgi:hypothetical protein
MSIIVYGARCTWLDSIDKTGRTPPGPSGHRLPCCPHCGSVLFQLPTEADWWTGVDRYEADGHPGYRAMITWARGKCFANMAAMQRAYGQTARAAPENGRAPDA